MAFRRNVREIQPFRPGRPLRELQQTLGLERLVKMASNEGPFQPLPAALRALKGAQRDLNRYPDGVGLDLRRTLAEKHDIGLEQVVLGNGADELIRLSAVTTVEPGSTVVFGWPSFPTYIVAALAMGGKPIQVPLRENLYDLEAMLAAVDAETRLVFVCTPNNPTGGALSRAEMAAFLDRLPEHVLCVVDEAYHEYVADPDAADTIGLVREGRPRLVALRTFSKVYGLAALRIGYAVASPEAADALDRVRNIFNANQFAQDAARACLMEEREEVERRVELVRRGREAIDRTLRAAGLDPHPSEGNFVFTDVTGAGFANGKELADALLRQGVMVRSMAGFGATQAIRVTVGTEEECAFFAEALAQVVADVSG